MLKGLQASRDYTLWVLLLILSSTLCLAQTGQGTITGSVSDTKGAFINGADVVLVNIGTGEQRKTKTTDNGTFSVPLLQPAVYQITASYAGFRPQELTNIRLTADGTAQANFVLQVGQVTESVEVKADAELITAQGAAIGEVIDQQPIVELPLNGRNPAALITLAPGAFDVTQSSASWKQQYTNFPSETAASVSGQRQGEVYYTLDGANAIDSWGGLATPMPNPDATQEFRVTTNNADAESGFSSGGTVSIVTKSGTNQWHGDFFEFVRNGQFNSKGYFAVGRDELHRNQFGGSVGGKIVKDKLFAFFNYQRTVEHRVSNSASTVVPNNAFLSGDYSALCPGGFTAGLCTGTGIQLHDFQGHPYLNNHIDPSTYSPVSLNIEALLPKTENIQGLVPVSGAIDVQTYNEGTAKIDYIPSSAHHISFRTFVNNFNEPSQNSATNLTLASRSWPAQFQSHSVNWTWAIRPNVLNDLVFSYGRQNSDSNSGYTKSITDFGAKIATDATAPHSLGVILDNWGNCLCQNFNAFNRDTVNITESITLTKGKHLIVAGVDVLDQHIFGGTDWGAVPYYSFDGGVTGNWAADFLLGRPTFFTQSGGGYQKTIEKSVAPYITDTIRLRPNLSVSAGLRWEPYFPALAAKNKMATYIAGERSQRFPNAPLGEVFPGDPGVPAGVSPTRWNLFTPRVGVAWQPKFLPHTSIRSGFGMFITVPNSTFFSASSVANQPFSPLITLTPSNVTGGDLSISDPWVNYVPTGGQSPFPPFSTPSYNPPKNATFQMPAQITYLDPNFTAGKNESWNLSVERQIGQTMVAKVAYVGSHAYDLPLGIERNPAVNNVRPNALFQSMGELAALAVSSYDGLQLSFEKRFSKGLLFSANYTWSKTLDDFSVNHFDTIGGISDPFNIRHDYGISDLNFPKLFNTYWVYQSPKLGSLNPVARGFLGAWELSGVWHMQSGRPFSLSGGSGGNRSGSMVFGDRADLTGQPFNAHLGSKHARADGYIQYFNPNAIMPNALGTFGNSGRNILQADGAVNFDLAASKNFYFKERYRLQIRAEAFNAFNHSQFGVPDNNPDDIAATYTGVVYSIASTPRVMQFAGKFYW